MKTIGISFIAGKIFFNAKQRLKAHGDIDIMSLWTPNSKKTEKTTVKKLLAKTGKTSVRFYTSNW